MKVSEFIRKLNGPHEGTLMNFLYHAQLEQKDDRQQQWKIGIANLHKALDELEVLLDAEGDPHA